MNRLYRISIIFTVIVVLIIALYGYRFKNHGFAPSESDYENYYDYFIQRVRYEQKIGELKKVDSIKIGLSINFKKYFRTFDQLIVEDGWILDCYYASFSDAGFPILYVRRSKDKEVDLVKTFEDHGIFRYCDSIKAMDHIKLKNEQKGSYQLLIFELIGEDFAKFQHANYGRIDIVCSKRAIIEILNRKDSYHRFDSDMRSEIKRINYLPIVREYGDSIVYNLVMFNPWRGFTRETFSIQRSFPHKLRIIKDSVLIEYNCGILF